MGFFTTNFGLGEEYANPTVSQIYQPSEGGATSPALTSRQSASDPLSQLAKAMSGNTSGGYGGSGTNSLTDIASMLSGSSNTLNGGLGGLGGFAPNVPIGSPIGPIGPINQTPIGGDSGSDYNPDTTQGIDSYQALQDYLNAGPLENTILSGALGMLGIPSSALSLAYGINPYTQQSLPWYAGSTDDFGYVGSDDNLEGANLSAAVAAYDLDFEAGMTDLSQDEYIAQYMAELAASNATAVETPGLFGGFFDNWFTQEPTATPPAPIAPPTTQEYVVPDNSGTIDNVAGGYTWDSDLGTVEEMQEETGLGTSEWDTSHEDFSWGEESWDDDGQDTGDGFGDWDSDAESDMDEDSGWSGADSDFDDDSGGGDSGGGDGGSYIATAATQALGEDGLTIFEEWRDYMFDALPTFTTSYGRYRVTAPKIVAKIDTKENSKHIYSWIWDMHLKPIFDMIVEDKDSEKALKDYKIMVKDLQNKFLKEKV